MNTIGDLVKCDQQAEFRNDVQLGSYEDVDRNLSLVRSYLFTTVAPQGSVASTSVLYSLMDSFLSDRLENRFVVIANYGHGKSHLALALANYFGKPFKSLEVQTILEKIDKAFSNSATALRYKEFKENRGEFLVVRIRGDVTGSLREHFLNSLEKALSEHKLSGDLHLPGWYERAQRYLEALRGSDLQKANRYLEQQETDVPMLIQDVKLKRDRAYDLFVNLYAHLDEHGFKPDMGSELSLDEAIRWAAREFCGSGKPLGGILVLFDEFNLYITNYAQRSAAGDLQDMLNGVSNCQGKVAFLAFAQQDPITIAQHVLAGGIANQRDSLLKELTRIPKQLVLYSLMESVISSYLNHPNNVWQYFVQDSAVSFPLSQATNVALEQFNDRYEKLGWSSIQKFDHHVTKGCFPLHPITTALLCSVQFQQSVTTAGTPRNILGFILEHLGKLAEQPALIDKRINWVLPIDLVDYFGERLPAERYQAYQQAIQRVTTDDETSDISPDKQIDVLKALLLQEIAKLKARDEDQLELVASMIGSTLSETKKCLRFLSDSRVIAWNQDGRKSYNLWSISFNPYKLDQLLERKLEKIDLTWQDLLKFSRDELGAIPVSVPWGAPQDWRAPEYIIDCENFNANSLKDLISRFSLDAHAGLREGDRGCIIWLLARNEDEIAQYRQNAQKILEEAFPEHDPLPIIVLLPSHANYDLPAALRRKKVLELFTQTDKEEVGQDSYRARVAQEAQNVNNALLSLRGGANYRDLSRRPTQWVVPSPYRARVQQLGQVNLIKLLEECYCIAYRFSPSEFFPQYSVSARNFRTTVKTVSIDLLHNDSVSLNGTIRASSSAGDLVTLIRQKWQLLTTDNRAKEPEQGQTAKAWELLDHAFPSGQECTVGQVLVTLFNPPYGYDYNTATLLFCIWFGYNAHDLEVRAKNRLISSKDLVTWIQEGPKDFINSLCVENVTLARRDAAKVTQVVKDLLATVRTGGFTKTEAQEAIATLRDFADNDKNDAVLIEEATRSIDEVEAGLGRAKEYEAQSQKVSSAIGREKSVKAIFGLVQALGSISESTLVLADAPSVSDLRNSLIEHLEKVVEQQCASLENLHDITHLKYNRSQLEELGRDLSKTGLSHLIERVEKSISTLDSNGDKLRDRVQDMGLQTSIRAMKPSVLLKDLYGYRESLQEISGASSETLALRDQQQMMIEGEIRKLEAFALAAENELDQAVGQKGFEEFRGKFSNYAQRYEGTTYQEAVEKVQKRVDELRRFYDEVQQLSKRRLNSREDVRETQNQLNAVGRKHLDIIGDQQRNLVKKALADIDDYTRKQEQQALRWLEEQEVRCASGTDLPQLRARLDNPPAFFPDEARNRIDALVQSIDRRFDENVVERIESYFLQIKDRNIREACLARLHKLLEEEEKAE